MKQNGDIIDNAQPDFAEWPDAHNGGIYRSGEWGEKGGVYVDDPPSIEDSKAKAHVRVNAGHDAEVGSIKQAYPESGMYEWYLDQVASPTEKAQLNAAKGKLNSKRADIDNPATTKAQADAIDW